MRSLNELGLVILLAVIYLVAVYFAVSALAPALAIHASFLAAMLAIAIYLFLVIIRQEERGIFVALLFLTPVVCVAAGVLWWLLRVLGLWEPIR